MGFALLRQHGICVLFVAAVAGCGGSGGNSDTPPPPPPPPPPSVQSVTVTPANAALEVGQTVTFRAVARDQNGGAIGGVTFNWSTSDPNVAIVDNAGVATAVATGAVTVRASASGVTSNSAALAVSAPGSGRTSDDLIAAALAAGQIDAETALVYRAFSNFGDPRLPAQFTGLKTEPFESTVIDDILAAIDTLSPTAQAQLAPFLMRPSSTGSWLDPNRPLAQGAPAKVTSSASGSRLVRTQFRPTCNSPMSDWKSVDPTSVPVRVWYDSTETGHDVVAANVATIIETQAWPVLVGTLGYKAPLDDSAFICDGGNARLDVYIVRKDSMDELGKTLPENSPSYDRNRAAVHVRIKANLGPQVLEHTVAHELAHAIHYAYPTAAPQLSYGWFRDAFANWAALQVYPGNLSIVNGGSCLFDTPEQPLDETPVMKCPAITNHVSRVYGAYLPLEAISWKRGQASIKSILEATAGANTAFQAMEDAMPGAMRDNWGFYAQALWNQAPIDQRADSYVKRHTMTFTPRLAQDQPNPIDANLNGSQSDETLLDARVNNMAVKFYHFTFSDPQTRSLMFHNTWRDERRAGKKVSVYAMWKPQGRPWVEEDLTDYEWIGFCRDQKDQRLETLVIVVSSAEWSGANPVVQAANVPKVMRNNIGCWGYAGVARRTYSVSSWSGQQITEFNARYDYHPNGTPIQYTDLTTGRLRVPIAAPLFSGGDISFNDAHSESGCTYSASLFTSDTTIVLGGSSAGTILLNNFLDAMPDDVRNEQIGVTGTAERAYVANGVTDRSVLGTVTGGDPCGTKYETGVGPWLLTRATPATSPKVGQDGHLRGFDPAGTGGDTDNYEWDLEPLQEP